MRERIADFIIALAATCLNLGWERLGRWLVERGIRFAAGPDAEVRIVWDPKEPCDCVEHESFQEHWREERQERLAESEKQA